MKLDCGCELKEIDGKPQIDYDNINLNCKKTWDLLATGKTSGIFQLENLNLGGRFSKKIQPKNIKEVGDITAVIRPGCLNVKFDDGDSAAIHYIHRHNKEEEEIPIDPSLVDILKNTHQIQLYQEQSLKIASDIAGFDPITAMKLQKGISKKKADVVMELRPKFIEGCIKSGLTEERAKIIYDSIEKSNRYSFVLSHAMLYGQTAVACAYAKAHFPVEFLAAAMRFAKDKPDRDKELEKIVKECKEFNIDVYPASHLFNFIDFTPHKGCIRAGISNIKGIGESVAEEFVKLNLKGNNWYEILIKSLFLGKKFIESAILAGFFKVPESQKQQLYDFNTVKDLTGKPEKLFIKDHFQDYTNVRDLIMGMLDSGSVSKKRIEKVESILEMCENPPEDMIDSPRDLISNERKAYGCTISLDNIDTVQMEGNCTIQEFLEGKYSKEFHIICEVRQVKENIIKKGLNEGKTMAFANVFDHSGEMPITCFNNIYDEYGGYLYVGSTIILCGYRDKKGHGFIVTKVLPV